MTDKMDFGDWTVKNELTIFGFTCWICKETPTPGALLVFHRSCGKYYDLLCFRKWIDEEQKNGVKPACKACWRPVINPNVGLGEHTFFLTEVLIEDRLKMVLAAFEQLKWDVKADFMQGVSHIDGNRHEQYGEKLNILSATFDEIHESQSDIIRKYRTVIDNLTTNGDPEG